MTTYPPLPIDDLLPSLLTTLTTNTRAVLQAPPGAGKTTRVPLALLGEHWLDDRAIVLLEPRRLAARTAAMHMSALLGEQVGETVGYRIRLDSRVGPRTRIEVVTEGVLIRLLQDDPELRRYGAVIIDEYHERNLLADLGLALTLDVQRALRDDLRLLVMSATLDGAAVATLLDDAPTLQSAGRSFPVTIDHRALPRGMPLETGVAKAIRETLANEPGSLLVFLPGDHSIRRVADLLDGRLPADCRVARLHGSLTPAEQDAAIRPAPPGQRKIVLSTNIAETSLTIDGVRVVIDAGYERRPRFDPGSGMTRLHTQRISQAAAAQRAGRAGRLEPGAAIRLWPAEQQARLRAYSTPEMLDADLAALVLELAIWGCPDPDSLSWLDPPPAAAWDQARTLLQTLGAIDDRGSPTAHGRAMQRLGVQPRLAHLLLQAQTRGWQDVGCALAALLGERDPLPGHGSDITLRLRQLPHGRSAHWQRLREQARRLRQQLPGATRNAPEEAAAILLGLAWPDRIAQRRPGSRPGYRLSNGRGAVLPDHDPLGKAPWLVVADSDNQSPDVRIRLAAELPTTAMIEEFAALIEARDHVRWDDAREAVVATRQQRIGVLVLDERPLQHLPDGAAQAGLLDAIRRRGLALLPWQERERQWQARVMLLHALEPADWPAVDDASLLATLDDWLLPWLDGLRSLADLRKLPLQPVLDNLLDHPLQQRLNAAAPTRITVPGGSRIAIDYCATGGPVLAVKLQELFGLTDTPRIADQRVTLTLHLLSPAGRPVQITSDLGGFWRGAYADVRKDLRGRYPRHPWPEDPINATPTRQARRRSSR